MDAFLIHSARLRVPSVSKSRLLATRDALLTDASENYTIIGSDNGLLPSRRQSIIWTSAVIVLIVPLVSHITADKLQTTKLDMIFQIALPINWFETIFTTTISVDDILQDLQYYRDKSTTQTPLIKIDNLLSVCLCSSLNWN